MASHRALTIRESPSLKRAHSSHLASGGPLAPIQFQAWLLVFVLFLECHQIKNSIERSSRKSPFSRDSTGKRPVTGRDFIRLESLLSTERLRLFLLDRFGSLNSSCSKLNLLIPLQRPQDYSRAVDPIALIRHFALDKTRKTNSKRHNV